jgi:DNA processing protein
MSEQLICGVALTMIPGIGPVQSRLLLESFGDAASIFSAGMSRLRMVDGLGEFRAKAILSCKDFTAAEAEILFMGKQDIQPVFLNDANYPKRLLNCYDSPILLYVKGNPNLNPAKAAAIVGTRTHTPYGKQITEQLIAELAPYDVTIISGLAHGIDGIAHKAALKNQLPTLGILAHGLDKLYPQSHIALAREIIETNGGLITEFRKGTQPDRHNFPSRNRIVAGMSDVVIVIETGMKGGSIITAEIANGYNRDVMAYPGRVTDNKSEGCNYLIRTNKAGLLTNTNYLLEMMGWADKNPAKIKAQQSLFIELSPDERDILTLIEQKQHISIDELNFQSKLTASMIAATLLNLELKNMIQALPGKMYQIF